MGKDERVIVTQADIMNGLRAPGLGRGMDVLVHGSPSSFGYVEGGTDTVIDALLETVGPEVTALMPTLTGSEAYHIQPDWVAAQVVKEGQARTIHILIHRYGFPRDFERIEPIFRERGIQRDAEIGRAHVRLLDARRMAEVACAALRQNPNALLKENLYPLDLLGRQRC